MRAILILGVAAAAIAVLSMQLLPALGPPAAQVASLLPPPIDAPDTVYLIAPVPAPTVQHKQAGPRRPTAASHLRSAAADTRLLVAYRGKHLRPLG